MRVMVWRCYADDPRPVSLTSLATFRLLIAIGCFDDNGRLHIHHNISLAADPPDVHRGGFMDVKFHNCGFDTIPVTQGTRRDYTPSATS
jgi:hypothetical protein